MLTTHLRNSSASVLEARVADLEKLLQSANDSEPASERSAAANYADCRRSPADMK